MFGGPDPSLALRSITFKPATANSI